jgi:CheY-like chemotaxis protein
MTDEIFSVLLVDDDQHTGNMFQMVMDHYHLPLTIAPDAESAIMYLGSHSPDVIVLDIFLPGIDGFQAFQRIRKDALAPQATLIATTAYYTDDTQNEIMAWGFAGYLPKPLNPSTLIPSLQEISRRDKQPG